VLPNVVGRAACIVVCGDVVVELSQEQKRPQERGMYRSKQRAKTNRGGSSKSSASAPGNLTSRETKGPTSREKIM